VQTFSSNSLINNEQTPLKTANPRRRVSLRLSIEALLMPMKNSAPKVASGSPVRCAQFSSNTKPISPTVAINLATSYLLEREWINE
jgi:hypothetical protein